MMGERKRCLVQTQALLGMTPGSEANGPETNRLARWGLSDTEDHLVASSCSRGTTLAGATALSVDAPWSSSSSWFAAAHWNHERKRTPLAGEGGLCQMDWKQFPFLTNVKGSEDTERRRNTVTAFTIAAQYAAARAAQLEERLHMLRAGRKQLIALGFLLTSALPLGLLLCHQLALLILGALLAGLGSALITPALESSYLDRTPEQHRSRMMGVRESVVSLGAVAGPLLLAFSSRWLSPQRVFTVSLLVALAAVILTLAALELPGGRGARGTQRDTSERVTLVCSTLSSILEEVQVMRQPTSLLAEAESTTDLTRRSPAALSEWH